MVWLGLIIEFVCWRFSFCWVCDVLVGGVFVWCVVCGISVLLLICGVGVEFCGFLFEWDKFVFDWGCCMLRLGVVLVWRNDVVGVILELGLLMNCEVSVLLLFIVVWLLWFVEVGEICVGVIWIVLGVIWGGVLWEGVCWSSWFVRYVLWFICLCLGEDRCGGCCVELFGVVGFELLVLLFCWEDCLELIMEFFCDR